MPRCSPLFAEAIARWTTVGLSSSQATTFAGLDFRIVDLPGDYLGLAMEDLIYLDIDAAGIGWHIGPTDAEVMGVDLLSVVAHELGHTVGLDDLDPDLHYGESMAATLAEGVRRIPDAKDLLFGDDNWL